MLRPAGQWRSSPPSSGDHITIDVPEEPIPELPLHHRRPGTGRREFLRFRWSDKLIHLIPVIVLVCLFILWWFSNPDLTNSLVESSWWKFEGKGHDSLFDQELNLNVETDDGRITAVHSIEMSQSLNETHVDFTILASSTPPIASVPQILAPLTEMASELVSVTD